MNNSEKPNWFTTKKVKVQRKLRIVDEIKCSMCEFKVFPNTAEPEKLEKYEEEVIIHAMESHTIKEFYDTWDQDEIWDEYSFKRCLCVKKSHQEESPDPSDFYYNEIAPKITLETIFWILLICVVIPLVVYFASK